ncbi:hypothetical protein MHYP_G00008000 [Metynnis hypsauchen]
MCGEIIFGNGTKLDFVDAAEDYRVQINQAEDTDVLNYAALSFAQSSSSRRSRTKNSSDQPVYAQILFGNRTKLDFVEKKAAEDHTVQANQAEDIDILNYAALSFAQSSSSRRSRTKNSSDQPVYAQAEDTDVLNYAALSFAQSSSSRRSRAKNSSDQPVYAQVKTHQ